MDAAPFRSTGDPKRVNQTCTEVVLGGQIRATDSELREALTHGGPNPGGKIRAMNLELGNAVTHGGQNPEGEIRATDSELGNADTHLNNIEDP